jgi:hypothetical protein
MDYKPTEKQRTTLELLQYISIAVPAAVKLVYTSDMKVFDPFVVRSKTVTAENFIEMLDMGEKEAMEGIDKFTSDDLSQVVNIFQMGEMSKGVYLVETAVKWLSAYKMQLFLYAKASGNSDIGTSNLWGGMDMPAKS